MKKVIAINGSKRKKNTYKLLIETKDILAANDIELEIINLYEFNVKYCLGCEKCVLTDKCILNDDMFFLMDKLANADGLIISSPVYLRQVTGCLKTFTDRTCSWFHRPPMYAKPLLAVSTTKGSGLKSTLTYIAEIGEQWGMMRAGSIGRNIRNIDVPVSTSEVSKFIHLINYPKSYNPTLLELMNFQVQKAMSNHIISLDDIYWKNMGWKNKSYYFDCKVNPIKNLIPQLVGKIIDKNMEIADINFKISLK